MTYKQSLRWLVDFLKSEYATPPAIPDDMPDFDVFRALCNVRRPKPIDPQFLQVQDSMLLQMRVQKGDVSLAQAEAVGKQLYLWRGDITRLAVDGIVNAANSDMLGCFSPCHGCIDNAIHTFAGVQLRLECAALMQAQGHSEPTGCAKITGAYNLPARHVLHTVGPIISGPLRARDRQLLADCYNACLHLAQEHGLQSLAFCCISTGEFRFPKEEAARIAIDTVRQFSDDPKNAPLHVLFNVFTTEDEAIYRRLLQYK